MSVHSLLYLFSVLLLALLVSPTFSAPVEKTDDLPEEEPSSLWSVWKEMKSAWNNVMKSNHAEGWEDVKDALGHLGGVFKKSFHDAKQFYTDNKDDLEPKVRGTMNFLNSIKTKFEEIDAEYNPQFQSAVRKVKKWLGITEEMEERIENGEDKELLKQEWKAQALRMFDEGLGDMTDYARAEALTSSSIRPTTTSFVALPLALVSFLVGAILLW